MTDLASESVTIIYVAEIELDKEANVGSASVGDTITYTFTVTNTGDITLTGVSVVDDMLGSVTLGTTTLVPDQSTSGTKTYTVVEGDLPGPIINTATATGTDPVGGVVTDLASESVSIIFISDIELVKEADVSSVSIGNIITYTFTVTNTGYVTLTGVSIVDDMLGSVTLGTTTLASGQSITGMLTYTVACDDLPGPIINTATATGTDPVGGVVTDLASESVSVNFIADISIDKKIYEEATGLWKDEITLISDVDLLFKITVTNIGNVPLDNVELVDDLPVFLTYNYDANLLAYYESDHQIKWNLGTLPVNDEIIVTFSAYVNAGEGSNDADVLAVACGYDVSDEDTVSIVALPCPDEVWVDDDWWDQNGVDAYDPSLIWQYNAFRYIQDGVDIVCDCGIVHVRDGNYYEQILINKDVALLGEPGATIKAPAILSYCTIEGSTESWAPLMFAYGGTLINNDVSGSGTISVMVNGFIIDGRNKADTVDIMYRNVRSGCVSNAIVNNSIQNSTFGIAIWSSSDIFIGRNLIQYHAYAIHIAGDSHDTMIEYNWILENDVGILVTEYGGFEPDGIEAYYNYIYSNCAMDIGIDNQVSNIVEATHNWWGTDGPSGGIPDAITGRIADGYGEQVIGNVHFDPWAGVEASGSVTPTSALTGDIIHYDSSDSFAYGGTIGPADWNPDNYNYVLDGTPLGIQYFWDFDDGLYSFQQSGSHIYDSPGTYTVVLRVRALDGYLDQCDGYYGGDGFLFDFKQFTVTVSSPSTALAANADAGAFGGYEGIVGESIQFHGSATGGMPPYTYSWSFGDGSTSDLQDPVHTYETEGTYIATLTVTDNDGTSVEDTAEVIVYSPDELLANAGGPYASMVNEAIQFQGTATGGTEPYTFVWDFGDGTPLIQGQSPVQVYREEGIYIATLYVIDSDGSTDDHTAKVTIIKESGDTAEIKNIKGGLGVKATIQAGDEPVDWSINIDGRFVFYGGKASGAIDTNAIQTVKIPFSLGVGKVGITITANSVVEKRKAFMLGPFVLSVKEE